MENPGSYVDDFVFNSAIFAWPCVSSKRPPAHWWIITWRGVGCPLHDAVGVNCTKGATIENQGADAGYMDKGMCVW